MYLYINYIYKYYDVSRFVFVYIVYLSMKYTFSSEVTYLTLKFVPCKQKNKKP